MHIIDNTVYIKREPGAFKLIVNINSVLHYQERIFLTQFDQIDTVVVYSTIRTYFS